MVFIKNGTDSRRKLTHTNTDAWGGGLYSARIEQNAMLSLSLNLLSPSIN